MTAMRYRIEFYLAGWCLAAEVKDADLARLALRTFRKESRGVEWRITDTEAE